jgi:hypothetical protein
MCGLPLESLSVVFEVGLTGVGASVAWSLSFVVSVLVSVSVVDLLLVDLVLESLSEVDLVVLSGLVLLSLLVLDSDSDLEVDVAEVIEAELVCFEVVADDLVLCSVDLVKVDSSGLRD